MSRDLFFKDVDDVGFDLATFQIIWRYLDQASVSIVSLLVFVLKVYANDIESFKIFSSLTQLGFSLYVNIAFRDIQFDLGELVFCKILHQNVGKDVLRECLRVPADLICKLYSVSIFHDLFLTEREGAGTPLFR